MAVTERFSPLRLSPQHNPVSAPMHPFPGASCVGRLYNTAREAWSPRLCCPPSPAHPAPCPSPGCPQGLADVSFSSRPRESWYPSTPPGRSSPPANHCKAGKASARPTGHGDGSSSLKLGAAPEATAPRAGGPASGGSSPGQDQGHVQERGLWPWGREKRTASAEEREREKVNPHCPPSSPGAGRDRKATWRGWGSGPGQKAWTENRACPSTAVWPGTGPSPP